MALGKEEFEELRAELRRVVAESVRNPSQYYVMPYRNRWMVTSREKLPLKRLLRSRDAAVELARDLAVRARGELIVLNLNGDVENMLSFKSGPSGEDQRPVSIRVNVHGSRDRQLR